MTLSWRIVTPDEWDRLPTEPQAGAAAVRRIAARQFRGQDHLPHLRAQLEDTLVKTLADARETGGVELYLSNILVGDIPLPTSLVVSVLPWTEEAGDKRALEILQEELERAELDDGQDFESTVEQVDGGHALRRITTMPHSGLGAEAALPDSFGLQWWFPMPGEEPALLLLSFSSPLVMLRDGLTELFDAVASTVRFVVPAEV